MSRAGFTAKKLKGLRWKPIISTGITGQSSHLHCFCLSMAQKGLLSVICRAGKHASQMKQGATRRGAMWVQIQAGLIEKIFTLGCESSQRSARQQHLCQQPCDPAWPVERFGDSLNHANPLLTCTLVSVLFGTAFAEQSGIQFSADLPGVSNSTLSAVVSQYSPFNEHHNFSAAEGGMRQAPL